MNSHVKMGKVFRRVPDTLSAFHPETQNQPVYIDSKQESKNTPIFLTPPQDQVKLNNLMEKKVGVTGNWWD